MRCVLLLPAVLACSSTTPSSAPPAAKSAPDAAERCLAEAAVTPERKADEPETVTVKHILVKHGDVRARGEACLRAQEVLAELKKGADFDELVTKYSDEAGAATRAGLVGKIQRSEVEPAFADAAFGLDVSQVSNVVETKHGFHVILRTE
ncbi:MAG TPA: peptidylprolyl isomerase [Polyangiaceae bacterium]|jgi:parvulin-like peptidyl-prolyl isomerase|nr:peptidylprolyl isomerase [Polyangiaceae bacterium]